jgi:Glycosyl transferase family 90
VVPPLAAVARRVASHHITSGTGNYPNTPMEISNFFPISFVNLASSDSETNRTIIFADPPGSTNHVYASVPVSSLNREIMDVAFVSSVDFDHYPGGLAQQAIDHRFDDAAVLSDYWTHKYLLDLDGMSYSGKFFAFLGSDSVVIKSSVYQEFFSDWIQPWCALFFRMSIISLR